MTQKATKIKRAGFYIALIVMASILLVLLWPVKSGCPYLSIGFQSKCEYERLFSAEELLVDQSFFQSPVTIVPISPLKHEGAAERFLVEIHENGSRIGSHEVLRWATSVLAAEECRVVNSSADMAMYPCGVESNIDYISPVASNFCAACTEGGHCRSVSQYQDYISIIELDLSSSYSKADFIDLLSRTDERFDKYLELETYNN